MPCQPEQRLAICQATRVDDYNQRVCAHVCVSNTAPGTSMTSKALTTCYKQLVSLKHQKKEKKVAKLAKRE